MKIIPVTPNTTTASIPLGSVPNYPTIHRTRNRMFQIPNRHRRALQKKLFKDYEFVIAKEWEDR